MKVKTRRRSVDGSGSFKNGRRGEWVGSLIGSQNKLFHTPQAKTQKQNEFNSLPRFSVCEEQLH
jgi:hypothetical protein